MVFKIVKTLVLFFIFLTNITTFSINSSNTILSGLKYKIDSSFNSIDTNIMTKNILFNTIKKTFDESKICYSSKQIGDSLFNANLYYDAILEYKRAKYYCTNQKFKDTISYKIAESLHLNNQFIKSNLEIKNLGEAFNFLQLANTNSKMTELYILNILKQKKYIEAYLLLEHLFKNTKYNKLNFKQLLSYREFSAILSGKISNIEQIKNNIAKDILSKYLNTPQKNLKTTYYLSTFLPGSGYIYNKNYKMGIISALVNIPLAIYLGSRFINISDGIRKKNSTKIITNSLDFVLIYNFVFSRYWKGARRESVEESENINRINRKTSVIKLKRAYDIY